MHATAVPPLRVEIRPASETSAPWSVFAVASTEMQARKKSTETPKGFDVRTEPNAPLAGPAVEFRESPESTRTIETLGARNLELARQVARLEMELETFRKRSAPPDAVAGPTPLPFGPGAILKDIHTGAVVTVQEINPPHPITKNPRAGFSWKAHDGQTGFVPYQSTGCFAPANG